MNCNFFSKNILSVLKMFVPLHPISKEKSTLNNDMPHSSSGPGHLPLTQKIISSTLICGTKAIESKDSVAFFLFAMSYIFRIIAP